jgi:DNA polymerase III alpha subunit (gram-positive type)
MRIDEISDELYRVSDLLLERFCELNLWLFDLEATGLDTTRERVTQIAGIMLRDGRIDEDSAFTQFVELPEGVEIPKVVRDLTGITPETLAGAPAFHVGWERHLEAASGADLWMGQSVFEFDVPLLLTEFERHGMPVELPPVLDSVVLATWLLGPAGTGERWSTSRLIQQFDVNVEGLRRHDALDDVKILGRILVPMLERVREEHGDRVEIPSSAPVDVNRHAPVRTEG